MKAGNAPIIFGQLSVQGIQRDVDRPTVRFEAQHLEHRLRSDAAERLAKVGKVFNVGAMQGVSDDLNVDLSTKAQRMRKVSELPKQKPHLIKVAHIQSGRKVRR